MSPTRCKALSEPMMVILSTHICATRLHRVCFDADDLASLFWKKSWHRLLTNICVNGLSHHWFGQWPASSLFLSQAWFTDNLLIEKNATYELKLIIVICRSISHVKFEVRCLSGRSDFTLVCNLYTFGDIYNLFIRGDWVRLMWHAVAYLTFGFWQIAS